MRAKEYAALYKQKLEETSDAVLAVHHMFNMLMDESLMLIKERHAVTESACIAVIREVDDKWRAISRILPELNPNGFANILWDKTELKKYMHDRDRVK